jgi:hypothetical protein
MNASPNSGSEAPENAPAQTEANDITTPEPRPRAEGLNADHDNNIIRCTKCRAIDPILNPAPRTPVSMPAEDVVDLSESPPTTQSTTVFATAAERFKSYDHVWMHHTLGLSRLAITCAPAHLRCRQTLFLSSSIDISYHRYSPQQTRRLSIRRHRATSSNFSHTIFVIDDGFFRSTSLQPLGKISCGIIIYHD